MLETCDDYDDQCLEGLCTPTSADSYVCGTENANEGGGCNADDNGCTVGDSCQSGSCVPGMLETCDDYDDQCVEGLCTPTSADSYVCGTENANEGGGCNADDNGCTVGDSCQSGSCVPGVLETCDDYDDQCLEGLCTPTSADSYVCGTENANEGGGCNADDNGCTVGDSCQSGSCVPGILETCDDYDDQCVEGLCTPTSADSYVCGTENANEGGGCNADDNGCTVGDSCQSGSCVPGMLETCDDYDDQCLEGLCTPTSADSYVCGTENANEGGGCNADDNGCTVGDSCLSGSCVPGVLETCDDYDDQCLEGLCTPTSADSYVCGTENANEGGGCNADDNGCTVGDSCLSGSCVPGNEPTDCSELDDDCNTGICVPTGLDSYACEKDPMGHVGDSCGDGPSECSGQDTCDGEGLCQTNHFGEDILCDDSEACTYADHCNGEGSCTGTLHPCEPGVCEETSSCDGMGGCDVVFSSVGSYCDEGQTGSLRCYEGECTDPLEGASCDIPIAVELETEAEFDLTGFYNGFTVEEPCSEETLAGPDLFFEFIAETGFYRITATPKDDADLAIVLLGTCEPPTCNHSVNNTGRGEAEIFDGIEIIDSEVPVLFSIDTLSTDTAGAFTLIVERVQDIDGDTDEDFDAETETELDFEIEQEWPGDGDWEVETDSEDGDLDYEDETELEVIDGDQDPDPDVEYEDGDTESSDGDLTDGDQDADIEDETELETDGDIIPDGDAETDTEIEIDVIPDGDLEQETPDGDTDSDITDGDAEQELEIPCTCFDLSTCCDGCHPINGDQACNDEDPCTGIGTCQGGVCVADELDCDDQNPCTENYCNGLTGCVNPSLTDGIWCDDTDEGWERCYDGQCLSINDGEVCDLPIQLQVDYPESFTTDGMINTFTPEAPCSDNPLEGPDVFFKVTLQPGTFWISVDPEEEADLAIVLIDSCDPIACTYSLDDAGSGGVETYGPVVVDGTRNEATVLFSVDSVSYEAAGSFEILIEKEGIVDGDEDLDIEPDEEVEIEDWPDGDIDSVDGDLELEDDLDESTEVDDEETTLDGDVEDDWDSSPDGDQTDDDIADGDDTSDGDVMDGDKEESLTDGDNPNVDGDFEKDEPTTDGDSWDWGIDGDDPSTDGDTISGSGGGGGCSSTNTGFGSFLAFILAMAIFMRKRRIRKYFDLSQDIS